MRSTTDDGFRRVPVETGSSYWEKQGSLTPFSRTFMLTNTGLPSLHHLVRRSGLLEEGRSVSDILESEAWDAFIRTETRFASWDEFREAAAEDATARQLLNAV